MFQNKDWKSHCFFTLKTSSLLCLLPFIPSNVIFIVVFPSLNPGPAGLDTHLLLLFFLRLETCPVDFLIDALFLFGFLWSVALFFFRTPDLTCETPFPRSLFFRAMFLLLFEICRLFPIFPAFILIIERDNTRGKKGSYRKNNT